MIINGNNNQINVRIIFIFQCEHRNSLINSLILNGNSNKVSMNRRNYETINKINNGRGNSILINESASNTNNNNDNNVNATTNQSSNTNATRSNNSRNTTGNPKFLSYLSYFIVF
jgi:competence protein ComGF